MSRSKMQDMEVASSWLRSLSPPNGFRKDYNSDLRNTAHLFAWSKAFGGWLNLEFQFSVEPGETYDEAFKRETRESIGNNRSAFIAS